MPKTMYGRKYLAKPPCVKGQKSSCKIGTEQSCADLSLDGLSAPRSLRRATRLVQDSRGGGGHFFAVVGQTIVPLD